jgi:hypothetical protein
MSEGSDPGKNRSGQEKWQGGLTMECNEQLASAKYRLEILAGIVLLPLLGSGWQQLVGVVFEELKKAHCNILYLLGHRSSDPHTVRNCVSWAQAHVGIAVTLLSRLLHVVPFPAWRELIEREIDLLAKVADDLANAERHADDPEALADFLTRTQRHIGSAMAIHTRLIEEMDFGSA